MKAIKNKLGFSLIELSIVILIIGILILGISKGGRIIKEARLKTAQALTTSSPVNLISGLRLWLETTSAKSFIASEALDGAAITDWNNINPFNDSIIKLSQTGTLRPSYIASGINGLPTVRFDFNNIQDLALSPLPQPITSEQLEVFVVLRRTSFSGLSSIVILDDNTAHDYDNVGSVVVGFEGAPDTLQTVRNGNLGTGVHPGDGRPFILSTRFNGVNNALYVNGTGSTTPVASTGNFNIKRIIIGARNTGGLQHQYNGDVSEMIVFDKSLSNTERKSVEQYLSQKYSIKLTK